ncbi:MAG TPA: FecR domain-containing protein [Saprospiraceae bacterium]|nr:FecR domain-containing protein [Saprospiraceae bacterium]
MRETEYILLLEKRCTGEISQEESRHLETWLNASVENRQVAEQVEQIWNHTEGYIKTFQPNLELDFQKVQSRIRVQPAPMKVSWTQRLMRVAAVGVLLLAGIWGWNQLNSTADTIYIASADAQSFPLADGSRVWLRQGSSISLGSEFSNENRQVVLKGEGYFEVAHDPGHPFTVLLDNGAQVKVLGTEFDIKQEAHQTTVLVRSGKVRFSPNKDTEGPVLTANQKAVFDHQAAKIQLQQLNSLNELSWQTGGLEFVNTPLEQVFKDLERFYDITLDMRNPEMRKCPHTAPLTSQPIEKVLESLALAHQMTLERTGEKSYVLSGGSCQ